MKKIIILLLSTLLITLSLSGCSSNKTLPKKCGEKKYGGYDWYQK